MPFKSDKQRRYLYKNKPKVAAKFAKDGEIMKADRRKKKKRSKNK